MSATSVVGLVLAGGRSVRFGGEKAVALLEGSNNSSDRVVVFVARSSRPMIRLGDIPPAMSKEFVLRENVVTAGEHVAFFGRTAVSNHVSYIVTVWQGALFSWDVRMNYNTLHPRYAQR